MQKFPALVNDNPTTIVNRMPADLQTFMLGSMARGSKAFHAGVMDPRNWFHIHEDFQGYTAAEWTLTENGNAGGTAALANLANGMLLMTGVHVADNDDIQLQWNNETVWLATGYPLWFETKLSIIDADKMALFAGLVVTDTTIHGGWQDGVGFYKEDGAADTSLDFVSDADGTPTTVAGVHTLEDDTFVALAFGWNGVDLLVPYVNGVAGTAITTNINDDVDMTVTFMMAVDDGAHAEPTMLIDYYDIWKLRS